MLKILVVTPNFPYPEYKDGTAKINFNLLKNSRDFQADVLTLAPDVAHPLAPERCHLVAAPAPANRLECAFAGTVSGMPFSALTHRGLVAAFAAELRRHLDAYDVIHVSTPYLAPIIAQVPARYHCRMLMFPIDSMSLFWSRKSHGADFFAGLVYHFEAAKWRRFESRYYRRYQRAVFVSEKDAGFVAELGSDIRTAVIPNGVDLEFFRRDPGVAVEPDSLVFTGDMGYEPNRDAALFFVDEVLPLVQARVAVRVYLVGKGAGAELKSRAGENVVVTGFVDDVRPYLDRAALYVAPLRFGSGIKNKVLEAMAMEKAVVGTALSFDGIAVSDGVECLKSGESSQELADKIVALLADPGLRAQMGARARATVERQYSWDSVCAEYVRLYQSISAPGFGVKK